MFSKPRRSSSSSRTRTSSSSTSGSATCPASCSTSTFPARVVDADFFTERPDVRRLVDPRLPGDPRVGHEAASRTRRRAYLDPFREEKTLNINFSIVDPFTDEPYSRDPRNIAAKAEAYLKSHRHRRHRLLRPRGGVLHLRRRALRDEAERELLLHRLHRGGLEHRPRGGGRQPRLQDRATRAATSPSRRSTTSPTCATRSVLGARRGRPRRRAHAPRGRHRRPGGDQLPVRHAAQVRRQHDAVQVRRQERRVGRRARRRRSCRSRSSATTARACTATSRCGRTASRSSTTRAATAACPTWPAGTSAACSSTPRRCWRSPTRR